MCYKSSFSDDTTKILPENIENLAISVQSVHLAQTLRFKFYVTVVLLLYWKTKPTNSSVASF